MKLQTIIICLMILSLIPVVNAENPITEFIKLSDFADYTSESTSRIEAEYSFTVKYDTTVQVNFTLTQDNLTEMGEWDILFIIGNSVEHELNETSPGVFESDNISVLIGTHNLIIIADAKPNVIPAVYMYDVTLFAEDEIITSTLKKSSSSRGSPYTTTTNTPTSTPTPTPISTPVIQTTSSGTVIVNVTTPEEPDEGKNIWWYILKGIIALILIILVIILGKKIYDRQRD